MNQPGRMGSDRAAMLIDRRVRDYMRSMTTAIPWPTPMHSDTSA